MTPIVFAEARKWLQPGPGVPTPCRWAYALCGVLSLLAIWGHAYPAGVDIPQHANLLRVGLDVVLGPPEYDVLYRVNWFTPYLMPYGVGGALAMLVGPVASTKCLLTFVALGTPWMMTRWLRTVGAAPYFGLFGFPLAFGFTYVWGFLSNGFALPLVFGYLAATEAHYANRSWRAALGPLAWGLALFFSHGIAFGVSCTSAGLVWLARRHPWRDRFAALHFVPLAAIGVAWLVLRRGKSGSAASDWFVSKDRVLHLFSSFFTSDADAKWALVSMAALLGFVVVAQAHLVITPARGVPFFWALALFLVLPEWLASTWLVGTRMAVFVQAFALALLQPRTRDPVGSQLPAVASLLAVGMLCLLNYRLVSFNDELAGLRVIAKSVPAGADVRQMVSDTDSTSRVFGARQLGQAPAWITAEQGGLMANDFARYFQLPVLRRRGELLPEPQRYIVARGDERRTKKIVRKQYRKAKLVDSSGPWMLFENSKAPVTSLRVANSGSTAKRSGGTRGRSRDGSDAVR